MIPQSVLDRVKEETGESSQVINDIYKSVFSLVVKLIRGGKLEGVRLMKFGVFHVDPKRLYMMKRAIISKSFDDISNG